MTLKTNILLITSDQQHWTTLGVLNPEIHTPNLDRLAAQGTLFERAYCPNPTCSPTRASIITGLYPSQHGCYSLGTKLSEKVPTVGEMLQTAVYRTALVGKAHFQPLRSTDQYPSLESYPIMQDLDFWRGFHGPFYGFDHVELARNHVDEAHVGQHYALWMEEQGCHNWRDYFQPPTGNNPDQRWLWEIPEEFHYNKWIADRSNALMSDFQAAGEPFFLWASFFDPHPPYLAPSPWDTMYDPDTLTLAQLVPGEHDKNPPHFAMTQQQNPDFSAWHEPHGHHMHGLRSHLWEQETLAKDTAVYYGMVSLMDKYIGQILDKLDELGLTDSTLVVFTSDHGHLFGQHGMTAKGAFHYEDLVKVPFIVRWPGKVTAGARSHAMQSLVDLAPTFLAAAGLNIPIEMTGLNQVPCWQTGTAVRDHIIVENRHQPTTVHLKTYVNDRYKLTVYYNRPYGELFDLHADPQEINNLWDAPEAAGLKADLMLKLLHGEMGKEVLSMPRIIHA
ncbi:MAG: sulfatase-like hydrolase/transferase [Anaerolineales bacterium]|nr:sulfatase-like hydrolase/transferase [Anaerolineales bacterium]